VEIGPADIARGEAASDVMRRSARNPHYKYPAQIDK
jgi:hypothetical protein